MREKNELSTTVTENGQIVTFNNETESDHKLYEELAEQSQQTQCLIDSIGLLDRHRICKKHQNS